MAEKNEAEEIGTFYCDVCGGIFGRSQLKDGSYCPKGHVVKKISDKRPNELWPEERSIRTSQSTVL